MTAGVCQPGPAFHPQASNLPPLVFPPLPEQGSSVKELVAKLNARPAAAPVRVPTRAARGPMRAARAVALLTLASAASLYGGQDATLRAAYAVADSFPWPDLARNDVAAYHIGNPFSPLLDITAPRYPYSEKELLDDSCAVQALLAKAAVRTSLAVGADYARYTIELLRTMSGPDKLDLYTRLGTVPAAVLAAAASSLVPSLVIAVNDHIVDISTGVARHFLLCNSPLPPHLHALANQHGFAVTAVIDDKPVHQSINAYDKGYIVSPDGSPASNAILEHNGYQPDAATLLGAADAVDPDAVDPKVFVAPLVFAMMEWNLGHLHTAMNLFGVAMPGQPIDYGMFVNGRAWLMYRGPGGIASVSSSWPRPCSRRSWSAATPAASSTRRPTCLCSKSGAWAAASATLATERRAVS